MLQGRITIICTIIFFQKRWEGFSIFFHTSNYNQYWREVLSEMLMLMDGRRIDSSKTIAYENGRSDKIPWDSEGSHASLLSA